MERLTQWLAEGVAGIATNLEEKYTAEELVDILVQRLAPYEDTGLEPEEIIVQLEILRKYFEAVDGIGLKRLREIAQAEKAGRLVVLPVLPHLKPVQENEMFICENGQVWAINVTGVQIGPNEDGNVEAVYETLDGDVFYGHDIGKTIFWTRQEAEEALKKMGRGTQ